MAGAWLDITDAQGTRRHALASGLTRIAREGDVRHARAGDDELHVWDDPPRLLFVGRGEPPSAGGRPIEERPLRPGDRVQWRGMEIVYGGKAAPADVAPLEEIAIAPARPAAPAAGPAGSDARAWTRLFAGLLVELGLADKAAAKRWQDAVVANAFEPDRCAQEILARSTVAADDPRVLERSTRLLRDLLMAPLLTGARGATRRARQATKGVFAMVLSQVVAFVVFAAIVLVALLLLRVRGTSIDVFLDRILPGR